jgi:hypothetical protein
MITSEKKVCMVCRHSDGYRCKNERIADIASLVTGLQMLGTDADTFSMRLTESACGITGKWWEPRE